MANNMTREQLVTIVRRMEQANEPRERIQGFVREYQRRMESPAPTEQPAAPTGSVGAAPTGSPFAGVDLSSMSKDERRAIAQQKYDRGEVTQPTNPVAPRSTALPPTGASGRQAGAAMFSDLSTLPLRAAFSAVPAMRPEGESFTEALGRTGAAEGQKFPMSAVEDIGRSTATSMALLGGPLVGGIGKGLGIAKGLGGLAAKAGIGLAQAAPSIAGGQIEQLAETGEFDPKGAAVEAGISAALPVFGELVKRGAASIYGGMMGKGASGTKALAKGFDPRVIVEEGLEGTMPEIKRKATSAAKRAAEQADHILARAAKEKPYEHIDADGLFARLKEATKRGGRLYGEIPAGKRKSALAQIEGIIEEAAEDGLTGRVPIDRARELKDLFAAGGTFGRASGLVEADDMSRAIRKVGYYDAMEQLEGVIPEIAAPNKRYHTLKVIADAADGAAERMGKNNQLFTMSNMMTALTGTGVASGMVQAGVDPMIAGTAGVGLMGAKALFSGGRGPAAMSGMGKLAQAVPRYMSPAITESIDLQDKYNRLGVEPQK